jgi:hypothetical protein
VSANLQLDLGVPSDPLLKTSHGNNEDAFAAILAIYARPGQRIVDPTFGSGVFWKRIDVAQYDAYLTDLGSGGPDMRDLPGDAESVDLVVLDPPYRYTPTANQAHPALDTRYSLKASAPTRTQGVIELYVDGIKSANRILKRGGFCVAKCQDTVQDGKQIWVHCELMSRAESLGFACRDIVVVTQETPTKSRWENQRHLRKAHSYFLVFRKGGAFPFGMPSGERR